MRMSMISLAAYLLAGAHVAAGRALAPRLWREPESLPAKAFSWSLFVFGFSSLGLYLSIYLAVAALGGMVAVFLADRLLSLWRKKVSFFVGSTAKGFAAAWALTGGFVLLHLTVWLAALLLLAHLLGS